MEIINCLFNGKVRGILESLIQDYKITYSEDRWDRIPMEWIKHNKQDLNKNKMIG